MADLEIPDPAVVILIGAAGAGKTTFAARHFPPDAILSSDAMRAAISGDPADQSVTRPAFAALHRALNRRLAAGLLAVVDATNVTSMARRTIRRSAARHGVPVVAIVLDLPAGLVRGRNAARGDQPVPDHAITRQLEQLASSLARGELEAEGYRRVVVLRDPVEVNRIAVRLTPRRG